MAKKYKKNIRRMIAKDVSLTEHFKKTVSKGGKKKDKQLKLNLK